MMLSSPLPLLDRVARDTQPLILCLAGNTIAPAVYGPALQALEPDVQVVGLDYLLSSASGDFDELAAAIAQNVDSRQGPTVLVGHSAGGALAVAAAALLESRLTALVVCSTGPNTAGHTQQQFPDAKAATTTDPANVLSLFPDFLPPLPLQEELVQYAAGLPLEAVVGLFLSQRQVDLTARLDSIACPTIVIHGTHDPRRPVSHGERLAHSIPGARLVLLDTGHNPMIEQPKAFRSEVVRLLASVGWLPSRLAQ
jgi:pimeloyl-ACP methyl ester carboxylesterase